MAQLPERAAYSYRNDPALAGFPDDGSVVVMDGDCALCSFGARLIARFDRAERFRICPGQTELGTALLAHYEMTPEDPESWLLIVNGQAYGGLEAIIRVGAEVGGVGHAFFPLRILPRVMKDWIYRRIARNRYALFGRGDMCAMPDARLQARLLLK